MYFLGSIVIAAVLGYCIGLVIPFPLSILIAVPVGFICGTLGMSLEMNSRQ